MTATDDLSMRVQTLPGLREQVAERLRDAAVGSDRRELGGGSLVLLLRQQDVRFGHLGQRLARDGQRERERSAGMQKLLRHD